ncbi:Basic-leucine zipper (bZIP) transcription factor family protein [Raphanus sativus]|nr:Basic-leucine zipper (bZIP) transcription factor family protein [Raphanus sativus]
MNKIVSSESLKELAASDPEHVKRILSKRQSAALSKEKKARIMMEEHELQEKLETLQAEAETLSAQIRLTQRGRFLVESKNIEMRIRYKETKQRVKLSDVFINELNGVVNRLKMEIGELRSESDRLNMS